MGIDDGHRQAGSLESRGQRYFKTTGSLKDNLGWFQAGDVEDGPTDAFIVIGFISFFAQGQNL